MTVPGWPQVFRGTAAVATGLVTPDRLRGSGVVGARLRSGVRSRAHVLVRRDALHPGEITEVDGVRITSRLRTAFDLAYPEQRLGIEYDGGDHFATPEAARADARRHTRLVAAGRRVLRYTSDDMRRTPDRIVAEVRCALGDARRDAAERAGQIDKSR